MPKEKVLVGGCLMRANEVNTIGWVGDADIKKWSGSAQKVLANTKRNLPWYLGMVMLAKELALFTIADIANQL